MTNTRSRRRTVATAALLAAAFLSLSGCSSGGPGPFGGSQNSYVSVAYGEREAGSVWTWTISRASGASSSAEARRNAERSCAEGLGASCDWSLPGTTGCVAMALSSCRSGCRTPALGMAARPTLAEARNRALAICRSNNTNDGDVCSIATFRDGSAAALCGSG